MKNILLILFTLTMMIGVSCGSTKNTVPQETTPPPEKEMGAQGERRGGPPSVDQLFHQLDTNEDGQLSKSEVKGPLLEQFDAVDTNGDGLLSRKEVENAPKPPRRGEGPRG